MKSFRYTDQTGKRTPWLPENPSQKDLEKLTVDQLIYIAKMKRLPLKPFLIKLLDGIKLT